jgi:hypothetical protein
VSFWGSFVTSYRLRFALLLLGSFMLAPTPQASALPSPDVADRVPTATEDASADRLQLAQAQPVPSPSPSPTPATQAPGAPAASPAPAVADEPIGNVATLAGTATVIRKKDSIALKLKDDIFLNDTVQTSTDASLGVTFNDGTTFHLSANARITIDTYVYEEGGSKNTGLFDIGRGTVAFVAASLAKSGDMHINTPTSVLGIRGTTGLVEVPEGGATGANNVNIKLYPDADGRVGQIEVNDRQGARLGTLTQGASGFSIRPGTGGARFAAVPLSISPQQAARDQGIVRQVHAAQTVGRQIVTEQRAIRRANPPGRQPAQPPRLQPNQQQPPRQPGQPQPGTQKGQKQGTAPQPGAPKGEKQTPTTPNGQKQTPGSAPQPGTPNRQGQQQPAPGAPGQGATTTQHELQPKQPGVPGVQHPASAPRPQPKQPRPAAPQKGKGRKHLP